MMTTFFRSAAAGAALVSALALAAPADARTDCRSSASISQVYRHLDGAIDQLGHDQSDYGGHKGRAMGDLQNARNELVAAQQWAITHDRDNPACFEMRGPTGGSDVNWGDRRQRGSNRDVSYVRAWVTRMIAGLQADQRDYDGHRVRAIADMQAARDELTAALRAG